VTRGRPICTVFAASAGRVWALAEPSYEAGPPVRFEQALDCLQDLLGRRVLGFVLARVVEEPAPCCLELVWRRRVEQSAATDRLAPAPFVDAIRERPRTS
jgi:hypothetical protein